MCEKWLAVEENVSNNQMVKGVFALTKMLNSSFFAPFYPSILYICLSNRVTVNNGAFLQ